MYQSVEIELAVVLGVFSHLSYFIRGEHHLKAPKIFRVYLSAAAAILILRSRAFQDSHVAAGCAPMVAAYFGALFSSIIIYRLFFHQLRHFPGPILARTTKLYHASHLRNSTQYVFMECLHQRYGDFVRTGMRCLDVIGSVLIVLNRSK